MITVLNCLGTRHNPPLVVLAALLCCIGALAAVRLVAHGLASRGVLKVAWLFLAALVLGAAVWTTHFVAILAYVTGAPVRYDPTLTIVSLLVAIFGSGLALSVATMGKRGVLPTLGGGLLGCAIAAMHYVGLLAYQVDSVMKWNGSFLAASVVLSVALGALSMAALRGQIGGRVGVRAAPALLVAATLTLHFTGMAAMEVIPLGYSTDTINEGAPALAIAIVLTAALIFSAGGFAYLIDARTQREAQDRIARMALTDSLTELPNLAAFVAELRMRVGSAQPGERFAVIAFEIAAMSAISQQFGASIADAVVRAVASRVLEARKPGVFLARTGGAQFCGVGSVTDRDDARDRAEKIYGVLARELLIEAHEIPVDLRIGVATFPGDSEEADVLLQKTQTALARALADPLEPIALYDEVTDTTAKHRLALASHLRSALDRDEFELFYQPQVWIADRQVIGYEALLRWRHPVLGMVSPGEFIPVAEKAGTILSIGSWAIRTACMEATTWPEEHRVAVNVSPLQLRQIDLPERIQDALEQSGLAPDRLEIELTESLLIDDRQGALETLRRIKALGVRLALDDFGTGYSSIDVLRHFPFDKVKLDRSYVAEIETNRHARAILHAMLALGRELSIPILVEGVETERQLAILRNEGCKKIQGYLTGRPMPATAIPRVAPERFQRSGSTAVIVASPAAGERATIVFSNKPGVQNV